MKFSLRALCFLGLIAILFAACAPTVPPGEKDREHGEQATDQLPK